MGTIERPTTEDLPPAASTVSPELVRTYRLELTRGEDVIDPETFSGSIPQTRGVAPRVRVGRDKWFNLLWLSPIGFVLVIVAVAIAKGLRNDPAVQRFIARNPGAPAHMQQATGMPAWLRWQHFFNLFLMIFIIRSGIQVLADHPRLYWTRHSTPGRECFRIQKPVPPDPLWRAKQDSVALPGQVGLPGLRHSIGLARWWHLGMDVLWLLNGVVFYILLFTTSQWRKLIPTSTRFRRVSRPLSIQTARSLLFLVMAWLVFFIVVHVTLVFTTGVLSNLNHIYEQPGRGRVHGASRRNRPGRRGRGCHSLRHSRRPAVPRRRPPASCVPTSARRPRRAELGHAAISVGARRCQHAPLETNEYAR